MNPNIKRKLVGIVQPKFDGVTSLEVPYDGAFRHARAALDNVAKEQYGEDFVWLSVRVEEYE